jgi:hypothetical protein
MLASKPDGATAKRPSMGGAPAAAAPAPAVAAAPAGAAAAGAGAAVAAAAPAAASARGPGPAASLSLSERQLSDIKPAMVPPSSFFVREAHRGAGAAGGPTLVATAGLGDWGGAATLAAAHTLPKSQLHAHTLGHGGE